MPWNLWNQDEKRWMLLKSVRSRARALAAAQDLGIQGEPRRVVPVLEQHGTNLMRLPPSMIWKVAMDDIARRDRNRGGSIDTIEHYAFHRSHVIKSETPNDILRAAIENPDRGLQSAKVSTRLLYRDLDLLRAALK